MDTLVWIKATDNDWLFFESFANLETVATTGVYIIWHGGQTPRVVYVGQGDICARLTVHRKDKIITAYNQFGTLRVTWAAVPAAKMDGVERYLADRLQPLVGNRHPDASPIPVNLPWAA